MMPDTNHLLISLRWVQSAMLGSTASAIAIVAVAVFGFGLISGHAELRRGVGVVLGCFILFGAPLIAAGLLGLTNRGATIAPPPPPPPALPTSAQRPTTYDPYAGAAVPKSL